MDNEVESRTARVAYIGGDCTKRFEGMSCRCPITTNYLGTLMFVVHALNLHGSRMRIGLVWNRGTQQKMLTTPFLC